ncbi:MAG TPA: hypothetical protein VGR96_14470 [Acidobacteriaceae bacterium]|nr:hypothetical protein [Acidobacteriaceae bacterium]
MIHIGRRLLWTGIVLLLPASLGRAQSAQAIIQEVVAAEHAADQNDHSQWTYLEEKDKPSQHVLQWVATSAQSDVQRVLEQNEQKLPEERQRELIQNFLHDPKAQKKQIAENSHDNQQIDDLLRLLPAAFVWKVTGSTPATTSLHFEPAPNFRPPTREARVFSSMTGDLVADNQQHRVRSIHGRLIRDVTFGAGILGRLRQGSTFSLEQQQVDPRLWQLTAIHVHLEGSALLFKSVSLQEDDQRSHFEEEPSAITLSQAAERAMREPAAVQPEYRAASKTQ